MFNNNYEVDVKEKCIEVDKTRAKHGETVNRMSENVYKTIVKDSNHI